MSKNKLCALTLLLFLLIVVSLMSYLQILPPMSWVKDSQQLLTLDTKQERAGDNMKAARSLPSQLCILNDDVSVSRPGPKQCSEEQALEIFQRFNVVLVGVINQAYLPFAHSWLCNTEPMDVHRQVLIFTTDVSTQVILRNRWPNVKTASLNVSSISGDQTYSKVGYLHVIAKRALALDRMLQVGVRVLWIEFDCVWLDNPVPMVLAHQPQADILATKVSVVNQTASGFVLLNPTPATTQLIRRFAETMETFSRKENGKNNESPVDPAHMDQIVLWDLISKKYAGARFAYLPYDLYPDGNWYLQPLEKRKAGMRPVIINNNFIAGNVKKIHRAMRFGHWFLENGSESVCFKKQVYRILSGLVL